VRQAFDEQAQPGQVLQESPNPGTRLKEQRTVALVVSKGPAPRAVPDLTGKVLRWGETDDGVFIELTLRGNLGRKPVEWTVVDRIVLEDGKIRERRSYFDSVPLLKAVALRPRASLPLLVGLFRKGR